MLLPQCLSPRCPVHRRVPLPGGLAGWGSPSTDGSLSLKDPWGALARDQPSRTSRGAPVGCSGQVLHVETTHLVPGGAETTV